MRKANSNRAILLSKLTFLAFLYVVPVFSMGSRPKSNACKVNISTTKINSWMNQYVPRGANGRSSAAAIYKINKQGYTEHVVFRKNEHVAQAVASTQKMLAAYTAYKLGGFSRNIRWTSADRAYDIQGGRAILYPSGKSPVVGQAIPAKALVKTLIRQSSNGAALALSRSNSSQSSRSFMESMNHYAYELIGEETRFNSYFHNPAGLTDNGSQYEFGDPNRSQLSTADNMARFMGKLGRNSGFKKAMNKNGLTNYNSGQISKVGSTRAAGKTVVVYIPLPRCSSQGVAVALFGESSSSQFSRMNSFIKKLRIELGYSG